MTKTQNYNLNQWAVADPIRREDFNADNAAVDAALAAIAASVGSAGNCRIATGSYTGDGKWGKSNPITLSMDFQPQWVMIAECGKNTNTKPLEIKTCILLRPLAGGTSTNGTALFVTWTDTSVSWYCYDDLENGMLAQNNYNGYLYCWVAVGGGL